MEKPDRKPALLLTVGTGDVANLEQTLLVPIRKSIQQGEWAKVILIPSALTEAYARSVRESSQGLPIEIRPLPREGLENDVDGCYANLDELIAQLRAEGFEPHELVVDFTRGTKAMSAALVLAAVRHDLPRLRYIQGERDRRGMVIPGTEVVSEVQTTLATGRKQLDVSFRFFRGGNFAAALNLLPEAASPSAPLLPPELLEIAHRARPMLQFYAHWDRLDYKEACKIDLASPPPASEWTPLAPTPQMKEWVKHLAEPFSKGDDPASYRGKGSQLRLLAADLLANGERRIRDGQFEDAVVRAYRVLELVGQIRLYDRGLDSARLPPNDPEVIALQAKLEKTKAQDRFGRNRDGTLSAARLLVARLLKDKHDPLARRLIATGETDLLKGRNKSLLIHGFEASGPADRRPLKDLFRELEEIIVEDGGEDARRHLSLARSLHLVSGSIVGVT
jgi:CRISPR-associated protein (TIGR02710 family)